MRTIKIFLSIAIVTVLFGCGEKPTQSDLFNTDAATPATFDPVKLNLKPVNEVINPSQNTIGILYVNKAAYNAQLSKAPTLQSEETFALVTWQRKTDPHWFGANIPGKCLSVETVSTTLLNDKIVTNYNQTGEAKQNSDTTGTGARMHYILSLRPVVMP